MDESGVAGMTEFIDYSRSTRFSWVRRLWARFRHHFLPRLRLFFASEKKAEELVAAVEARRDFWEDVALTPAAPQPEPQAVPVPDPAPVLSGLTLALGPMGIGHVFYNGVELPWVKGIDVIVRPLTPVAVTIYMGARDGVHIESTNAALDFVIEPRPVVPAREDTDAK